MSIAKGPTLVLRVSESDSKPRTVSSFTASPPSTLTSWGVLAFESGGAVASLTVVDYLRDNIPAAANSVLSLSCADPSRVSEWRRFSTYLARGVSGTSAPKAAICMHGSNRCVILPPAAGSDSLCVAPFIADSLLAPVARSCTISKQSNGLNSLERAPQRHATDIYETHGAIYASRSDILSALAAGGTALSDIKTAVSRRIVAGDIGFPYKRLCIGERQVMDWFVQLRAYPDALTLTLQPSFPLHGYYPAGGDFEATVDGPVVGLGLGAVHHPDSLRASGEFTRASTSGGSLFLCSSAPCRASVPPDFVTALMPHPGLFACNGGSSAGSGDASLAANVSGVSGPGFPLQAVRKHTAGAAHASRTSAIVPFDGAFNEIGGTLVDYFSEPARMAAVRSGEGGSPLQLWRTQAVARAVVDKAASRWHELSDFSLRHGLYGIVAGCNLFRCHLARSLFALLGGTRVLDPCAGWGDRLLGALGSPDVVRYVGFDPNPALVPCHAAMIRAFGDTAGGSYCVIPAPFEDGVIPSTPQAGTGGSAHAGAAATEQQPCPDFDLVLTSPPYFDLEIYEAPLPAAVGAAAAATAATQPPAVPSLQSIATHPTLADWLLGWYFPMMDKAWAQLRPGGHMAIYINDHAGKVPPQPPPAGGGSCAAAGSGEILMCLPMLRHAGASLPGCVWVGALGVQGDKGQLRPLWLWRKGPLAANAAGRIAPLYTRLLAGSAGR